MSAKSPLLRALLILALVFNGAGVRAFLDAETMQPQSGSSCHDTALATSTPAPAEQPASGDCCADGQCDCACTTPPVLVIVGMMANPVPAPPAIPGHVLPDPPAAAAHGSPFRPPIA